MADSKISGLTTLADADVVDGDFLPIVDTSTTTTKKVGFSAFQRRTRAHNNQVGTTYTLALSDENKLVILTNGSPIELTVPPNGTIAFPIGTEIDIMQGGAGQVEVVEGSGVTVNKVATETLFLEQQFAEAKLTKYATNTWVLTGRLEPA